MYKNSFFLMLLLISFTSYSQVTVEIDSTEYLTYDDGSPMYEDGHKIIYANPRKNVSVFFPETIRQGITGTTDYTFTYNTEISQFFGVLKAVKSTDSNLLIITNEGQIYSFVLKYKYKLPTLNYFMTLDDSIGNEDPTYIPEKKEVIVEKTPEEIKAEEQAKLVAVDYNPLLQEYETINYRNKPRDTSLLRYNTDRKEYIRRFCSNLTTTVKTNGISKTNSDIELRLRDIKYNYNEMYFVMDIENKSGVDFDVNFLNISIANNKKRKRKSAQTILKKPLFTYQLLGRIPRKSVKRMVYVIPKFSINKQKKVIIELNEFNGERNVTLDVSKTKINNPS